MKKFSILMASYNNANYIQEAIDSIFAQTYSNWEVVIVDDKSTDDSQIVYNKYENDSRFHIYYNEKNSGCGYTKKRSVELSSGDLCGFLDSDDVLMPNAIETMVKAHAEHPECSLIYSTCYRYSGNRNDDMPVWDYIGAIPKDEDYLIYRGKLVSHFVTFKRSSYDKCAGLDPFLISAEDKDLYCKLEEVGKLLHIPIPLYYYRVNNPNSISIGTEEKDKQSYYYSVCSSLNTICRRMGTELYGRNKKKYLEYMRVLLKVYYGSNLFSRQKFLRYCCFYIKGNRFSLHSVSHVVKIIRGI